VVSAAGPGAASRQDEGNARALPYRLTFLIRPVKCTALPLNDVELIDLSP